MQRTSAGLKFTDTTSLQRKAAEIRLSSLSAMTKAGKGSVGSCMSVVDMLVALYYGELGGRPAMIMDQDYLILSKGQASPVQYAILADLGFFPAEDIPEMLLNEQQGMKVPGVTYSNFTSGNGLSVAVGLALSLKMERKRNRVYVVVGDGELQNGQFWEAVMAAAFYRLENLVCLIDNNKLQGESGTASVMDLGSILDKFAAFGWRFIQVHDGHDYDKLLDGIARSFTVVNRPVCICCNTVCGKGVDFAEGKPIYQETSLSEGELMAIIPKLKEQIC